MPTMRWVAFVPELKSGGRRSLQTAKWGWEAQQLRAHPGRWAILGTVKNVAAAGQQANNIRKGVYQAFRPKGAFEATARGDKVYARYVAAPRTENSEE